MRGFPFSSLFLYPPLLAGGAVGAVLAILVLLRSRRRAAARRATLVSEALAARAGLMPRGGGVLALPLALVAILGLLAALARPRWGAKTETVERQGADVAILIDTSGSMRAADVSPSRFVLARQAAGSLLTRLAGDRMALVAVEGEAQTLVPLTLDTAAVGLFLDAIEPGLGARPGSSLAAGLAAAAELFPSAGSGKHCVLISDGEDLEGGLDEAIQKAKSEGITIHSVLVGAPEGRGAPVPEVDAAGRVTGYKSYEGSPVLSKASADTLRRLAAATGGTFTHVSTGKTDLDGIAHVIDSGQKRRLSGSVVTNVEERFQIPLGIAVGAVALLLMGAATFRLPRRTKRALGAAAALLVLAFARGTSAQQLAPQPAPPAAPGVPGAASPSLPASASPASPGEAPSPTPVPSLLSRIRSKPPFTTARGEAKKGVLAYDSKRNDEAIERFSRQAELAPKDPTGAYNVGTALSRLGQVQPALAAFEKARETAAKGNRGIAADASYNTGETLYQAQKFDGAAKAFRQALTLAPGDADAAWNYELAMRRLVEEQKKKQQQEQKDQKKDQKQDKSAGKPTPTPGPSQTPSPSQEAEDQKKREEKEFQQKAKMSREKAEELLAAIQRADLEEQKKRLAEQRSKRRVEKDW